MILIANMYDRSAFNKDCVLNYCKGVFVHTCSSCSGREKGTPDFRNMSGSSDSKPRRSYEHRIDSGLQSYDGSIKKNRNVPEIKWTYRPAYRIGYYCY